MPRSHWRVGGVSITGRVELIRGLLVPRPITWPAAIENGPAARVRLFRRWRLGRSDHLNTRPLLVRFPDLKPALPPMGD